VDASRPAGKARRRRGRGGSPRRRRFPDKRRLTAGLTDVLRRHGTADGRVDVLARKKNPYESTFPTEIVTCRVHDAGQRLNLFIKYGTKPFDSVYGHRGDVAYEARVYRDVLEPLRMSTPTFYGIYRDGAAAGPWLIIEYLKGVQASHSRDPDAMIHAARWIGRFHARNEPLRADDRLAFLRSYNPAYYMGWARRADRLFAPWRARLPWLSPLCKEFRTYASSLVGAPRTVIHGEYFGLNIIYRNGTSWAADWQSAAIAPGEIDLASLTHSWPAALIRKCERAYAGSRWPDGPPDDFEDRLEAARLYMNFRWLGDPGLMVPWFDPQGRPRVPKKARKFLVDLQAVGERLGLVR
jgi:hypothetical protein